MLESCLGYEEAITLHVNSIQNDFFIVNDDWMVAGKFLVFLKVFYDATKALSAVYTPTSHLVLGHIMMIAKTLADFEQFPIFEEIIPQMRAKIVKYFSDFPKLFLFAPIMDPRIKLGGTLHVLKDISFHLNIDYTAILDKLEDDICRLYSIYEQKYATVRGTTSASVSAPSVQSSSSMMSYLRNVSLSVAQSSSMSATTAGVSELYVYYRFEYFTHDSTDFDTLDVLKWWKDHSQKFPVLSIMARDLLTPPASTVASESAFSAGGRVLDERRSRLEQTTLDCLICMKDWEHAMDRVQDQSDFITEEFSQMATDIIQEDAESQVGAEYEVDD
jgi:hypothetical protein